MKLSSESDQSFFLLRIFEWYFHEDTSHQFFRDKKVGSSFTFKMLFSSLLAALQELQKKYRFMSSHFYQHQDHIHYQSNFQGISQRKKVWLAKSKILPRILDLGLLDLLPQWSLYHDPSRVALAFCASDWEWAFLCQDIEVLASRTVHLIKKPVFT